MSSAIQQQVEHVLAQYQDPYLQTDLLTAKVLRQVTLEHARLQVRLEFGFPIAAYRQHLQQALLPQLAALPGVSEIALELDFAVVPHSVQTGLKGLSGVKNIIAVASGKGGVGKSTCAVNLALALQADGARVGLLDADIYGPSQPHMLGTSERPQSTDGKRLQPVLSHGLQSMSIGYLIDEKQAVVWRGPMVSGALQQLLHDTCWDNLDYLIVDLPPGTGDVQLTLAQKIPVSGAVIITTPQDLALLDARKAIAMFAKVAVPVLGVVENMSLHQCSACGHQEPIFGTGGGAQLAADYQVELLGQLPLDRWIREHVDQGRPSLVAEPEGAVAQQFIAVARRMAAALSGKRQDYVRKFPQIVIENR